MPVLKLNENEDANQGLQGPNKLQDGTSKSFSRPADGGGAAASSDPGRFYVAVDADTYLAVKRNHENLNPLSITGLIQGFAPVVGTSPNTIMIRVDQGLDTLEVPPSLSLDSDLLETAFIVEMDYRLGRVKPTRNHGDSPAAVNFIDDDNIASYYITEDKYVNPHGILSEHKAHPNGTENYSATAMADEHKTQVFEGPRGATLHFRIQASQELQTSTYLFTQIGSSQTVDSGTNILGLSDANALVDGKTIYYIDSTVRVIGANTGYRLDIPVRYVKIA